MSFGYKQFACGVVCLHSQNERVNDLSVALEKAVAETAISFALVYFSKNIHPPEMIIKMMGKYAPHLEYAACSTAGEITPQGMSEGEMMILLFPKSCFRIEAMEVAHSDTANMEAVVSQTADFKRRFLQHEPTVEGRTTFVLCLSDGMSYMEEAVTAALHWGLDDLQLLGGSAGDNMNFLETSLILNGHVTNSRAIVLMVSTLLPMQVFKTENFVPTTDKLVVTKSDPNRRVVHEFNGLPAASVFAKVIGADPDALASDSFASHPLVVRVGGEYYCRSIQKVNEDNSLTFFCAIDDGVVLTVAEPTGMANSTQAKLEEVKDNIGDIDFVLAFDCVLRQIDARNRQITQKISEIYQKNRVVGFNTYGEQYHSMHLNQTLTGVAFGRLEN